MRALAYTLLMAAIVLGALVALHHVAPPPPPPPPAPGPAAISEPPPLPEQVRPEVTGDAALARADTLRRLWHVREAGALLEDVLAEDSTRVDAMAWLVECYADPLVAAEDTARDLWRRALARVTARGDSLALEGERALLLEGDAETAAGDLQAARRAGTRLGDDVERWLAMAQMRAGRADDAARTLEALARRADPDPRAFELAVRLAMARGDTAAAVGHARALARRYPREPFPYVLMGLVDALRGRPDDGERFVNSALDLDPRFAHAIAARAAIRCLQGRLDAARVEAEKFLLFDDPVLQAIGWDGVASVEFLRGRFDEGVDALERAVRAAMTAGAVRRGLRLAMRLVDYLCELGQVDPASGVVQEWVHGFGSVPEALGGLRVDLLAGEAQAVDRVLVRVGADREWSRWARLLGVDVSEIGALARIASGEYDRAERILSRARTERPVPPGGEADARRAFLSAYAALEDGRAEQAAARFREARARFVGLAFPYRGDPVLHVQALFYLGECALAAGRADAAREAYGDFVAAWRESTWRLTAIERAMKKLDELGREGDRPGGEGRGSGDEGRSPADTSAASPR